MPLGLLIIIVVIGIAGIALLAHRLGMSAPLEMAEDDARARWLREWPDDPVTAIRRAPDGHAALVLTRTGPGLVWSFGADSVARRIRDAELTDCAQGLRIDLHDFAAPPVTLHLPPDDARTWRAAIEEANR